MTKSNEHQTPGQPTITALRERVQAPDRKPSATLRATMPDPEPASPPWAVTGRIGRLSPPKNGDER